MSKYIHNRTEETITIQGRPITSGAYFQIPDNLITEYASDEAMLAALLDESLAMSADGIAELGRTPSQQIDFLKDKNVSPVDSEGSPLSRVKLTRSGWYLFVAGIDFETSKLNSVVEPGPDGVELGFATVKFYDEDDIELTEQSNVDSSCIKTVLDWEPPFDYDLIGGRIFQKTIPTEDVRIYSVMVPDVSAENGGSKFYICNINLSFFPANSDIIVDGRIPKLLIYDENLHTNKVRFILRHPAGFKHRVVIMLEAYKE